MPLRTQLGHGLAKVLGIKLDKPERDLDEVTRGESIISMRTADTFVEEIPTTADIFREIRPSVHDVLEYLRSLFPFLSWIRYYNLQWLMGDLVAGITIGAVVIPQGMSYAKLAGLPVQFGLYSSFMGVLIYWFFATSKDITIGPVAVMSQFTGTVVTKVIAELPQYTDSPNIIASALALIVGAIVCFIGLIRCGWIVEVIPLVSLASFMTGSAINIIAGQVPSLLGESGFSTRDATYLVIINILKTLPKTKLDAALGLTALFFLYLIRWACNFMARKSPHRQKLYFFLSTLRTVFVVLLYTMISWLVNMRRRDDPKFQIIGNVPRGFTDAGAPKIDIELIRSLTLNLPAAVIILLIEHIAISKSFGRVNNYKINPSQEMVAIGVTNLLGPFLGGYAATGSFSRTAIKSKAGVRTPFAGVITAVVVVIALYGLTAVFFYIPQSALAAVIIHAVGDLITPPNTLYRFWRVSPLEVLIWFVGVLVTIFSSIENGVYSTVCISFAVFLVRVLKTKGQFLGRVPVHPIFDDQDIDDINHPACQYGTFHSPKAPKGRESPNVESSMTAARNVFIPVDHRDGSNPMVEVKSPYPGIFIYRFTEGFNYPSANCALDYFVEYIFANTRRTKQNTYQRIGDVPWNEASITERTEDPNLPTLKAVILDFSAVNHVDATSVQQLIDVRNQLERYASPSAVDWHFACINSRWTKRALVSAGFGYPVPSAPHAEGQQRRWRSVFSVAEIGGHSSAAAKAEQEANEKEVSMQETARVSSSAAERGEARYEENDEDANNLPTIGVTGAGEPDVASSPRRLSMAKAASSSAPMSEDGFDQGIKARGIESGTRKVIVQGLNRPLFHIDLTAALQNAVANVEATNGKDVKVLP